MRMGQGVRTGLGHGGITCVLQTQFSSFFFVLILILEAFQEYLNCVELVVKQSWMKTGALGGKTPDIL